VIDPDIINTYFKEGPNSNRHKPFDLLAVSHDGGPMSIYLAGNKYVDRNENPVYDVNDQWSMTNEPGRPDGVNGTMPTYEKRFTPHPVQPQFPVTIHDVDEGKDLVLAKAGPRRLDAVDRRLLADFHKGGGYDPANIGRFPELKTYNVPTDTDNDGMPDAWERARGLDPNNDDSAGDRNGDGYTNIEEYINELAAHSISAGK
jgi:hypothetical protein